MSARDRTVLIVVAVVAAIAGAWFLIIQPKRAQVSKLDSQISSTQSQLSSARVQVAAGEAARSTFSDSYTTMARLGEAVPSDDNVPSLIVQVQSAATAAGIDFRGLALSASGSSAAPPPASASAAQANTAALPPGVAVGAAGFPAEPFTFTFNGNFFHLSDFFGRLQRFVISTERRISVHGRLLTLNAISLGPGPAGFPTITATVAATTYVLPASQGLQAGATPVGPAGASGTTAPGAAGAGTGAHPGTATSASAGSPLTPAAITGGGR